jgi:hypothetical protein
MRHILFTAGCFCLLLGLAVTVPARAQVAAEAESGLEFQQGSFGTGAQVETISARQTLRIRSGRIQAYASLAWQRIEAPANVVGGGGLLGLPIIIDPTQPSTRSVRQGIGDLRVGALYGVPAPGGVDLRFGGEVKLPTASARRGLGTGETDLTIAAEASRSFGAVTPFLSLSYTVPGNPDAYRLRDSLAGRGGIGLQLGGGLRGSLSYGHARSVSALVDDESQLASSIEANLGDRVTLGLTGRAGLSEGAPDLAVGVQLGWRLF